VLVSRGELIEIGDGFRIPEVMAQSGAILREVGTTNRTRLADYEAARDERCALVLRVHPSNFEIVGYTEAPTRAELVAFAQRAGLPLVEDLGSGRIGPLPAQLAGEPSAEESLAAGVDVVTFSGDKLLGGPQAGLVVGRAGPLRAMRQNPLYRALRVDKMTLAALDAILVIHESGRATMDLPTARMLSASVDEVRARATAFAARLSAEAPSLTVALADGTSAAGGGAAPTAEIPTVLLRLVARGRSAQHLAAALRTGEPPVVARVADDALVLDLRTVAVEEEDALAGALTSASTTATEIDRHD